MLDESDWSLRRAIYAGLGATGSVPERAVLAEIVGGDEHLGVRLRRLHDQHQVVLDVDGSIRMALPFSAIPTDHVVRAGDRRWFANCAWDALAIPAAIGTDAEIDAPCLDDGSPVDLRIVDGRLEGDTDACVHFVVPARQWWDDIVHT